MNQSMQILTSHKTVEWYTPPKYIEMAREVLGEIDLDPASCEFPQKWIKANRYFTIKDDGLKQDWNARKIWLNPPFGKTGGKSNQAIWSQKMIVEYSRGRFSEGILLINSTHGYKWYEDIWNNFTVCCMRKRIKFIMENGEEGGEAKRGQTFVYMGDRNILFSTIFNTIGRIIVP